MRFGTWNVRSLYWARITYDRSQGTIILDILGVLEVRWDKGGTARAEDCTFH
jgi:hypothetical protein